MGSGSNFGTDVGQNLLGPFASRKPRQDKREYQIINPWQGMEPQQQFTEDMMAANLGQGTSINASNPYVGPRPEQERSMAAMEGYQGQAEPLYGQSLGALSDTVGGKYLDVANRPEWQRLSSARQNIARDLFGEALTSNRSNAAARGNYDSSARVAQLNRERGRIGNQAAQDIASAGWNQYGAERGYMQDAAKFGAGLAPSLAGQVFGMGEQLRGAEQAGNTAQMQAQVQAELGAAGIDQGKIDQWLRFMQMSQGQVLPHQMGPSPLDTNLKKLQTEASAFGSVGSGAAAMCWIAAELYGSGTARHLLARHWIAEAWTGPVAAAVRFAYRKVGRTVAKLARRSPWLRARLLPWFDRAVVLGARSLAEG